MGRAGEEAEGESRLATGVPMPTGLVTMVFTDIEGSTKLLQRLGDGYGSVLADHHAVLRQAISDHRGYEVDTAGDGFFVTFASALDATTACLAAQRALRDHPGLAAAGVRVRMGIHTGEVQVNDGDYLGLAVHQAARISAAGHGGQVLVSETTHALIGGDLGEGVELVDLGLHELKDLARPIRLHQLAAPDIDRQFPPVRSLSNRPNNLPRFRTSFVGRGDEVAALHDALAEPGLVTLTGPGGCGKTRLAVEAARDALDRFPGGAFFVDLRDATQPDQARRALHAAVGVVDPDDSGTTGDGVSSPATVPLDRVVARLARDPALVILDNCEHLVDACADVADELLGSCPELRIVATSRDLLGVTGEIARRVPSLAVSGAVSDGGADPPDDAALAPALRLFADRARQLVPSFRLDEESLGPVTRICERLDGIPLAIELAAGRIRHMSPAALEEALDDMFRVLVGSDRRSLQRHQTLEAVVGWSHDLLDDDERAVLRRLSVFAGGFTVVSAAAVCADDDGGVDERMVGDHLFRLVDRSLVERVGDDRYRLLETIKAYAQARLHDAGEAVATRQRHLAHFVERVATAGSGMRGGDFLASLDDLEPDADNVRAALEWAVETADHEAGLRIAADVGWYAYVTDRWSDLAPLIRQAVAAGDQAAAAGVPVELRARAHAGLAVAGWATGDKEELVHAEVALDLYGEVADDERDDLYAWSLASHAAEAAFVGDPALGPPWVEAAVEEAERRGFTQVHAMSLAAGAWCRWRSGELEEARRRMADAVRLIADAPNTLLEARLLFWSGILGMYARDWAVAREHYERGLPLHRRLRMKLWLQWELDHVSNAALHMGDLAAARAYAEEGLQISAEGGLVGAGNYAGLVRTLGVIEERQGDLAQAAMHYEESLELTRAAESAHGVVPALLDVTRVSRLMGSLDRAIACCREAVGLVASLDVIELSSGGKMAPPVAPVLEGVAGVATGAGRFDLAGEMLGAASAWRERTDDAPDARVAGKLEELAAAAREAIGAAAYDAAVAAGREATDPLARATAVLDALEIPATVA